MVVYVITACVFAGVSYWISPGHIWSAISPVLGGFIGLLLTLHQHAD